MSINDVKVWRRQVLPTSEEKRSWREQVETWRREYVEASARLSKVDQEVDLFENGEQADMEEAHARDHVARGNDSDDKGQLYEMIGRMYVEIQELKGK